MLRFIGLDSTRGQNRTKRFFATVCWKRAIIGSMWLFCCLSETAQQILCIIDGKNNSINYKLVLISLWFRMSKQTREIILKSGKCKFHSWISFVTGRRYIMHWNPYVWWNRKNMIKMPYLLCEICQTIIKFTVI